jgi:hypothetical protein
LAKVEIKRAFPGKDSSECYQASLRMVEKAGYQIFKKREIASLVICEGNLDGQHVDMSAMTPFGFPTAVVITLSSEAASEDLLKTEASRLFTLLEAELKR